MAKTQYDCRLLYLTIPIIAFYNRDYCILRLQLLHMMRYISGFLRNLNPVSSIIESGFEHREFRFRASPNPVLIL
jgi:hypothetical protein